MTPDVVLFWASAMIYTANGYIALLTIGNVKRCTTGALWMERVLRAFLSLVFIKSALFLFLKASMYMAGNMPPLSVHIHIVWLFYEWISGLVIMLFVLSIRAYLQWRCIPALCPHPRRRVND